MTKLTMNREEAARALGVGERTIDRLIQRREIAFTRIAGRVVFTEAHLTEYLARNTQPAVRPKAKPKAASE